MTRPSLLLLTALTVALGSAAPATAGTCVSQNVPRRGEVTVCSNEYGCDVYLDPGGRTIAFCLVSPADTSPFGFCADLTRTARACALTEECAVFVTTGRPPGVCV